MQGMLAHAALSQHPHPRASFALKKRVHVHTIYPITLTGVSTAVNTTEYRITRMI